MTADNATFRWPEVHQQDNSVTFPVPVPFDAFDGMKHVEMTPGAVQRLVALLSEIGRMEEPQREASAANLAAVIATMTIMGFDQRTLWMPDGERSFYCTEGGFVYGVIHRVREDGSWEWTLHS